MKTLRLPMAALLLAGLSACALEVDAAPSEPAAPLLRAKPTPPPPPPTLDYSGYYLTWSDEFETPTLDTTSWTAELGNGANGWGNNELEYYTDRPENVRIENGALVIEARQESYEGFDYTSARLKTQGKKSFQYGIIEARIQSPTGSGLWPAFWMMGNDLPSVGWPRCGEVDIMENKGTNTVYQYAHWFNEDQSAKNSSGTTATADIAQYHVYSVRWDASVIEWYIDGVRHHSLDITPATRSEYRQEFFLLLNLAVGGNFTGRPRRNMEFPVKLLVDWVRVYQ